MVIGTSWVSYSYEPASLSMYYMYRRQPQTPRPVTTACTYLLIDGLFVGLQLLHGLDVLLLLGDAEVAGDARVRHAHRQTRLAARVARLTTHRGDSNAAVRAKANSVRRRLAG